MALVTCLLIIHRIKRFSRKLLLAMSGAAALAAACLLIYGYQSVAARLQDFSSVDQLDRQSGRRKIWTADLAAMTDFPIAGTGLGSHVDVYPRYLPEDETTPFVEFTHAESGYVQVGLETGVLGLVLLGITIGLCAWWCLPAFRRCDNARIAHLFCRPLFRGSLHQSCIQRSISFGTFPVAWSRPSSWRPALADCGRWPIRTAKKRQGEVISRRAAGSRRQCAFSSWA